MSSLFDTIRYVIHSPSKILGSYTLRSQDIDTIIKIEFKCCGLLDYHDQESTRFQSNFSENCLYFPNHLDSCTEG